MTSKEAFLHTCKPGHWLVNVAALGEDPDWREQPSPNHVDINAERTLFGYSEREFMRKQYR